MSENVDVDALLNFDDSVVNEWAAAEVTAPGERKQVPDGTYEVRVQKCAAEVRKGKLTLNWHLKIVNGNNKGSMLFKTHFLDTDIGRKMLKQDLYTCGLKLEDPRELKESLPKLLDLKLKVAKKAQKDTQYYNVYINQLLDSTDADENEGVDPEVGF